jgi:hypothetical protein
MSTYPRDGKQTRTKSDRMAFQQWDWVKRMTRRGMNTGCTHVRIVRNHAGWITDRLDWNGYTFHVVWRKWARTVAVQDEHGKRHPRFEALRAHIETLLTWDALR